MVHSLTQEKNRLGTAPDAEAHQSIQQAIEFYNQQLRELDRRIAELTSVIPRSASGSRCWSACQVWAL